MDTAPTGHTRREHAVTWTRRSGAAAATLVSLAAILSLFGPGCAGDRAPGAATDLIPADAVATLTLPNLEASLQSVGLDSIRARHPEAIDRFGRAWRRQIGFDPTDPAAARAAGIDPGRPMVVALLKEPEGSILALLPGSPDSLLAGVARMVVRQGGTLREAGSHAGIDLHDADRTGTTCLVLPEHLAVVTGVALADERLALCRRLLDGRGEALTASDGYTALLSRIPADSDAILYARSAGDSVGVVANAPRSLERLRGLLLGSTPDAATAMSVDLRPEGLRVESVGQAAGTPWPGLRPRSLRGAGGITRYLGGEPVGLLQTAVRGDSLVSTLQRSLDAMATATDTTGQVTGATTRLAESTAGRLLAHADGRVGVAVYSLGFTGVDLVLYAELLDPEPVGPMLAALAEQVAANPPILPLLGRVQAPVLDEIEGVPFHRLPVPPFAEVCWGVVHESIVVTVTRERMAATIRGAESFVPTLPVNELKSAVHDGAAMVAYLDVTALGGVFAMLPVRTPETREIAAMLEHFDYLSGIGTIDDDYFTGSMTLQGNDPNLWPVLLDAVLSAVTDRAALLAPSTR